MQGKVNSIVEILSKQDLKLDLKKKRLESIKNGLFKEGSAVFSEEFLNKNDVVMQAQQIHNTIN
jgi:hypothetical protein